MSLCVHVALGTVAPLACNISKETVAAALESVAHLACNRIHAQGLSIMSSGSVCMRSGCTTRFI